jgi:predicted nucleic acid-binding protein
MERVFADTGYWIALLNPRDELREKASAASGDYASNRIVTSEMVLTEFQLAQDIIWDTDRPSTTQGKSRIFCPQ